MSDKKLDGYVCPFAARESDANLFWADSSYLEPEQDQLRQILLEGFMTNPERDNLIVPLPSIEGWEPAEYAREVAQKAVDTIALTRRIDGINLIGSQTLTIFQAPFYKDINPRRVSPQSRLVTTKRCAFARAKDEFVAPFHARIEAEMADEKRRLGLESNPSIWPIK